MSSNWEIRFSKSRQLPYFFNTETNSSTWEKPEELNENQINSLPGIEFLTQSNLQNEKVKASHLLVKHRESRRPSSWKEKNITRSIEEAEEILRNHAKTLGNQPTIEEFASLAKNNSDCSSASKGGDLGNFSRGQMQKPFEDAAFGLKIGQMSDVIKSDSGLHLILRTG